MPQLMIDTAAESPASLRLLAVLLTSYAALAEVAEAKDNITGTQLGESVQAAVAAHTHTAPVFPQAAPIVDTATEAAGSTEPQSLDPAAVFQKNAVVPQGTDTNVVQLFPGAPSLPAIVNTAGLPAVVSPAVQTAAGAATVVSVELDKANIPWDARIHQSNRNKKADGTWMLKRGLDKAVAEAVLAELTGAKLAANAPAAPAAGPVSLPPAPVGLPLPPGPLPLAVGQLPTASAVLPLPPVPNGLPPAAPTPVELFRAMMAKIGPALAAKAITQEQVTLAHQALNLPQLQLAITRPELIPHIEAALGL